MTTSERVLVSLDGSEQSERGLEYASERFPEATILCFHAIDPFDPNPGDIDAQPLTDEWLETEQQRASELFDRALDRYDVTNPIERETSVGSPAQSIVACAEESDADHVIVGSYGRGEASQLHLGSVAEIVVRRAPVPVTVIR